MHLLLIVLGLLFAPLASPASETCDGIHALVGGDLVEWVGYDNGGWQLPADLKKIGRVDFASGGAWAYHSESDQARYVWFFLSYIVDGTPAGAHDFCGPYRIADAAPLFGKYVGTYWKDQMLVGRKSDRVVVKDYEMDLTGAK